MRPVDILREDDFTEVTEIRPDAKNRIYLGKQIKSVVTGTIYKVYRNSKGQIILDPQIAVPAGEAWLYQNDEARKAVKEGLNDAKAGRVKPSNEDFSRYLTDDD